MKKFQKTYTNIVNHVLTYPIMNTPNDTFDISGTNKNCITNNNNDVGDDSV